MPKEVALAARCLEGVDRAGGLLATPCGALERDSRLAAKCFESFGIVACLVLQEDVEHGLRKQPGFLGVVGPGSDAEGAPVLELDVQTVTKVPERIRPVQTLSYDAESVGRQRGAQKGCRLLRYVGFRV